MTDGCGALFSSQREGLSIPSPLRDEGHHKAVADAPTAKEHDLLCPLGLG